MDLNWLDLLIVFLLLVSVILGWRRGFLLELSDIVSWLASLWVGIRFYHPLAQWIANKTVFTEQWSRPISFLLVFFLSLSILRLEAYGLIFTLPPKIHQHLVNRVLGTLPGLANGVIYAIIVALLLMNMPLPERIQNQARDSEINNRLASYAEIAEAKLRPIFEGAIREALNARMGPPQSTEMVELGFSIAQSKARAGLEAQMLELVNKERAKAGLSPLVMDKRLTKAARKHSADMLARGYFSHYSPEGTSAFDRLHAEKITFLLAGENLAFAPTVRFAHMGLMNSPEHRANILRPQFKKVGIGIMDAGMKGIMVTQEFSN